MPALDSGAYNRTYTRPNYTRPRAQRFGAKRDQYGRVIPTTNVTPSGGLSREHDWSAFDRAFAKPAPVATTPVTPQPSPVESAVRTAGAVAATAMGGPMAALPATIQPPTAQPVTVAQPPAMPAGGNHARIVADPTDWRGKTGVANPPPATNNAAAPAPRMVSMKPIPAPLTGPMGNASTDAANLAQNQAMYAPGGMSETAYQRDARIAARNAARNAIPANITAAAGTGQNVAGGYGTAYSKPAAPDTSLGKSIIAKHPQIGVPGSVENQQFVSAYKTADGNHGNAMQIADGLAEIRAMQTPPEAATPAPVTPAPQPAPAPAAAPVQPVQPTPQPVATAPTPITPHSIGMAIYNTPGAIADVATDAYTATRDAVVPAVVNAANTVQTAGTDFTAGLQGKTPEQWRAEISENERLKANTPQRPPAPVDTTAFRAPGLVAGPMGTQSFTAPRPLAPQLPVAEVPMIDAYARKKKAAQPMLN